MLMLEVQLLTVRIIISFEQNLFMIKDIVWIYVLLLQAYNRTDILHHLCC